MRYESLSLNGQIIDPSLFWSVLFSMLYQSETLVYPLAMCMQGHDRQHLDVHPTHAWMS